MDTAILINGVGRLELIAMWKKGFEFSAGLALKPAGPGPPTWCANIPEYCNILRAFAFSATKQQLAPGSATRPHRTESGRIGNI